MLKILSLKYPQQRQEILQSFQPQSDLWLTVDLESKRRIQDHLRSESTGFFKNCVLRLEDFWSQELFRYDPTWKIVPYPLVLLEADFFLQEFSLDWMKGRNGSKKLVSLFETLGPYILHSHLEPLLDEWLEKNPEAQIRWRHLWEAVKRFAPRILRKKWITPGLVPHLLLDSSYSFRPNYKKVILDSGFSLRPVEYLVFEKIAQNKTVEWLKPEGDWFDDDGYWSGEKKLQIDIAALPLSDLQLMKFPSQLAETKAVVSEFRSSLEEGRAFAAHHLYLLEAETQWPALRWHMKKEGLPWQAQPMKLHGFQSVQRWLSFLRAQNPWALFQDQELSRFSKETLDESFDDFARKNRSIEYWAKNTLHNQAMSAEEFAKAWMPEAADPYIQLLVQRATVDFPQSWKLTFSQWVHYLENMALLIEVQSEEEKKWNGSLPLISSFSFIPNLHQDLQKDIEETDIPLSHLQLLRRDLGWPVDGSDSTQLEANLRWLNQDAGSKIVMSYTEKDFLGAYKIPHRLFTIWSQHKKPTHSVPTVRWSELQDSLKNKNLPDSNQSFKVPLHILKKEAKADSQVYLSPSALEKYEDCAFMLVAERHLRLSSTPDFELDLDHVTRGKVQHLLFEKVLAMEPILWTQEQALLQLLETAFTELKVEFTGPAFKKTMTAHYMHLLKTFVEQEQQYRQKHPQNKTIATELSFELALDENKKIRGRIDRVDQDKAGQYWVSDYKSSSNGLNNWNKWLEKGEYQLALYAHAIEQGGTRLPVKEVLAATYIVVRDGVREKGLFFEQAKESFLDASNRSRAKIEDSEWQELKAAMKKRWLEIFEKYQEGQLLPEPKDIKVCATCGWRGLCRAKHLR